MVSARDALNHRDQRDLLVNIDASHMAFNQGAGDAARALDAQVLGVLFLAYDGALGHNPQAARR